MAELALLAAPDRPAPLANRDPRLRIVAAIAFALVTLSLQRFPPLLAALCIALALTAASGLRPGELALRLLPLQGFMLILLLMLPFTTPGAPWLELGPLAATEEGLRRGLVIALKAHAVVIALLALLGTLEPVVLGHALGRLGVPEKLVHLLLFTVRYIGVFHTELRRLRLALRARAFVPRSDRHTWRTLGWLIGMLLVRSLERSRRVLAAMKCRGFHGRLYLLDHPHWRPADSAAALAALLLLLGLLTLDRLA